MTITENDIWQWLEEVTDPEIPVLTVVDLGIVRDVEIGGDGAVVTITPTYSGCPAMHMIEEQIKFHLESKGLNEVEVKTVLDPPWTTDWLSDEAKKKLEDYGIAPPQGSSKDKNALFGQTREVKCPHCKSTNTEMISQFGSTACKALYRCKDCREPFDYFKCL